MYFAGAVVLFFFLRECNVVKLHFVKKDRIGCKKKKIHICSHKFWMMETSRALPHLPSSGEDECRRACGVHGLFAFSKSTPSVKSRYKFYSNTKSVQRNPTRFGEPNWLPLLFRGWFSSA